MRWLVVATILAACLSSALANCNAECLKSDSFYKKSCPDGLDLGDECEGSKDGKPIFCATPYSRCMDGKCACLPDFEARNVTFGQPAICVPTIPSDIEPERDPSADICRYQSQPGSGGSYEATILVPDHVSEEYNRLVMPSAVKACEEGCHHDLRGRRKRQANYVLPPTVVSACRSGLLCFQIGVSAFGTCKKPTCPVGKPLNSKSTCEVGVEDSCPAGYHCVATKGQSHNTTTKTSKEENVCCPSVCDDGYYLNGRCWRETQCLQAIHNCEDRCDFTPCRFMVDPCENRGMCLVPKTTGGRSPDFFWCKCAPGSGKMGQICETDGESDTNRPNKKKRMKCEGSLCEPPPTAAYAFEGPALGKVEVPLFFPAPPLPQKFAQLTPSPAFSFPSNPTIGGQAPQTLTCRQDMDLMCTFWASIGDCTNDRTKMLKKCDCACTRLMNRNRNVQYIPVPATNKKQ